MHALCAEHTNHRQGRGRGGGTNHGLGVDLRARPQASLGSPRPRPRADVTNHRQGRGERAVPPAGWIGAGQTAEGLRTHPRPLRALGSETTPLSQDHQSQTRTRRVPPSGGGVSPGPFHLIDRGFLTGIWGFKQGQGKPRESGCCRPGSGQKLESNESSRGPLVAQPAKLLLAVSVSHMRDPRQPTTDTCFLIKRDADDSNAARNPVLQDTEANGRSAVRVPSRLACV